MNIALIGYEANIKNRVGSNQYAFELLKALYQLDKKNNYLIHLPSPPLPDLPPGRENWRYQISGPSRLWNIFGLPRALFHQRPKPDLVFNPGHYLPLFSPSPLVVSIMDLGYLRYPEQFTKPTLAKLKFWTAFSIKRATHILAISEFTRNDIIKTYQVDPGKVTATPLGFSLKKPSKTKQVKKKYQIKNDYLLYLGTLKPNKNIEGLLEAFNILRSDYPHLQLVIAGRKGWLYQQIFKKVKKLRLENQVIFTDFVPDDEVSGLISQAQVFILPSFWEGFGIPVLEAMALGTPVVVSQIASLPEVAGDAGVLVDPASSQSIAAGIKTALENKKELSKKGLAQAKKFSWEKCARQTLEVLKKVNQNV